MGSSAKKKTSKPETRDPSATRPSPPVFKIAASPEPDPIDSIGWTSAQGVQAAYRFSDAVRKEADLD